MTQGSVITGDWLTARTKDVLLSELIVIKIIVRLT